MNYKRIAIVGISGSGKSTLSRRVTEITKLPLFHMDLLFWKDNWEAIPESEYLAKHQELIKQEKWIIEGYIDKAMADRARNADLVIYLDYSGIRCFWRGLKRILKLRSKTRPELPQGCFDHFSHRFLWIILTRGERKNIEEALEGVDVAKIKRFTSPKELEQFLRLFNEKNMTKIDNHPYKDRKYDMMPYDQNWALHFQEYAAKIQMIFPNAIIEHIGSTSVPGMSGKSCIDLLVIVKNVEEAENHIEEMEKVGFEYAGQFVMENSRLFRVVKDNSLLANVHFFSEGHPHVDEMIQLRDYLRSHPEEVEAYSNLKKELKEKYPNDYTSYRKYKDEYMEKLKKRI